MSESRRAARAGPRPDCRYRTTCCPSRASRGGPYGLPAAACGYRRRRRLAGGPGATTPPCGAARPGGLKAKLVEYGGDPLLVGPRAAGLRRAAGPELGSARAGWHGVYERPARLARKVDGKDCQPLCASKVRWALDVGRRRGNDDAVVLSLSHPPLHVTGCSR